MKTVLGDAFYSYYILYHYFKIQKFAKNSKIVRTSKKKAQARLLISYMMPVWDLKTIQ